MSLISNIRKGSRLLFGLKDYLKDNLSLEESREIIRSRIESREELFLNILKKGVYENINSPYLKLLKLARIEFNDVKSMVLRVGIEETLKNLRDEGAYLTHQEFKCIKGVVRNGREFRFYEKDFNNPYLSTYYEVESGGSRSAGTRTMIDLDFLQSIAAYDSIAFNAADAMRYPLALWTPILPSNLGISCLFRFAKIGKVPDRWFSQIGKGFIKTSSVNKLGTNCMVYITRLLGMDFPKPEYVGLRDSYKIADWAAQMVKDFSGCSIYTYVSSAVRVCKTAKERGLEINGTKFFVGAEPITPYKRKEIESVGAVCVPKYGFTEGGTIGYGCFNSSSPDDTHLFKDSIAVIQHRRRVEFSDTEVNAFLFTSLLPSAPKILLNVESDDYGILEKRDCNCDFQKLGFTEHLHEIRSFGKLTSEGMTFVNSDLIRIFEEILPQEFGGSSIDYQLVEEDGNGLTRLSILVSPQIGEVNEKDLVERFLAEIDKKKRGICVEMWSQGNTIQVKRAHPIPTKRGKIFPFYIGMK
ncbi:MAG: hypothetical protein C4291_05130 [Candidatus Dadabacteria bacterium]